MRRAAMLVTSATTALTLAVVPCAYAHRPVRTLRIATPSLVPDPDGQLTCEVVAISKTPIGIVARIKSASGADVTHFGSGTRLSPEATGDGYYADESAGSFADDARYCEVSVTGARKNDVSVTLTSRDEDGNPVEVVEAR